MEKKEHPNRTSFFLVLRCFVCCVDSRDVNTYGFLSVGRIKSNTTKTPSLCSPRFLPPLPACSSPAVSQACLRSSSSLCFEFGLLHHFPTHHAHSQVNDILQPRPRPSLPPTYHQRYARPINPQTLQLVDDLLPATSHVDPRPRWACSTASRTVAGPNRAYKADAAIALWLRIYGLPHSPRMPAGYCPPNTIISPITHPPMQVAVTRRPCRQRTLPTKQSIIDEHTIISLDLNI